MASDARRAKQREKRKQKRLMIAAEKAIGIDRKAEGIRTLEPIARNKHERVNTRWDRHATGTFLVKGPKPKGPNAPCKPFAKK